MTCKGKLPFHQDISTLLPVGFVHATCSASNTTEQYSNLQNNVTLNSDSEMSSIQFNSIQFNSIQFNSIQFNSIQFNSIQFNSIQFNSIQFNSIQFNSIQFNSIQFNSIQFNSIQFNSITLFQTQQSTYFELYFGHNNNIQT